MSIGLSLLVILSRRVTQHLPVVVTHSPAGSAFQKFVGQRVICSTMADIINRAEEWHSSWRKTHGGSWCRAVRFSGTVDLAAIWPLAIGGLDNAA